jgi:hypothetical protein
LSKNKRCWQKKNLVCQKKVKQKASISFASTCANGAPTTNWPMPLWHPFSLRTQVKPILRPWLPSVETITTIKPKVSLTSCNEIVSTWTCVERCWSRVKDCIIGLNKCKSYHNNYNCHCCACQSFYKSSPT